MLSERSSSLPIHRVDVEDAEAPELWPATYPPRTEDEVLPWLPTDPIPNPEPESPGLGVPDPGVYEGGLPPLRSIE